MRQVAVALSGGRPGVLGVVLRTYLARWQFWMCAGVLGVYALVMLWSASAGAERWSWDVRTTNWSWSRMTDEWAGVFVWGMLLAVIVSLPTAIVTMHVRETTANWRGQLWPGYRAPHLGVGAVAVLGVWVAIPLLLFVGTGTPVIGVAAMVFTVGAVVAWCEYLQSARATLVVIAGAFLLVNQTSVATIAPVIQGRRPIEAVAVILLALAATAGLWYRIATVGERRRTVDGEWAGEPSGEMGLRRGTVANVEWRVGRVRNVAHAGFLARVRHWRLVTGAQRVTWKFAGVYAGLMTALPYLTGEQGRGLVDVMLMIGLMVCPLLVSALGGEEGLWRRRGYELLWPESRRRMVTQVLAASMIDFASVWFWMMAGSLFPLLYWVPEMRAGASFAALCAMVVNITAAHVVVFGLQLVLPRGGWRWLGPMTRVIVMSAVTIGFFTATVVTVKASGVEGVLVLAGALTLIGLLLIAAGYANWVEGDFE